MLAVPLFPHRNPLAVAAYYLGIFSLIPYVGIALGPVAILLGLAGLAKVRKEPATRGLGHAITGIVAGAAGLVVWGGQELGWWNLPFGSPMDWFR